MVSLLLMSVVVMSITIQRAIALLGLRRASGGYEAQVKPLLARGQLDEAATVRAARPSPIGNVIEAGLSEYVDTRADAPSTTELIDVVRSRLEQTVGREMDQLRKGLGALATIGSIAPFVGLFGTVAGIVTSFEGIAATGGGGLTAVSAGIAEALVATALGILVAIPAVVFFNYFSAKLRAIESSLEDASSLLINGVRKAGWIEGRSLTEAAE
ncbi:MotA/TolQ/ExbB proton channel family protein [Sandaracinus amylolyticus]|uniref:MotA/TolQ/ExbB proton channel family protein n=2 Tax=Sandaracinus amylolyticus TaxID=927083 RepID=A0A0F6W8B3_9BACT|nr:MotA/TolQ/ExbB proton channel family protein [Sandaracinus amylolyticus]